MDTCCRRESVRSFEMMDSSTSMMMQTTRRTSTSEFLEMRLAGPAQKEAEMDVYLETQARCLTQRWGPAGEIPMYRTST
jgi:hypothetical protein